MRAKIFSKRFGLLLATLFIACGILPTISFKPAADTPKYIDMYLIGGQSNAAGYSAKDRPNSGSDAVFENIWYAGETEPHRDTGYWQDTLPENISQIEKSVKKGQGIYASTNDRMGPEFGIAKMLSSTGNYSADNPAIIFKTAAGGTSLFKDNDLWYNKQYGNWYPRSLWNDGYTPDINATDSSCVGVMYQRFVTNFEKTYDILVANGYTPRVQGMVWMQGEEDLGSVSAYKPALKAFIADIRKDVSEITGNAMDASMPFIIGEIATTFRVYNNSDVPPFIEMQREIANEMSGVYTVQTADLTIVGETDRPTDGTDSVVTLGTDRHHFGIPEMITLGERFAEKILEAQNTKYVTLGEVVNGKITATFNETKEKLTISATPLKNYKLTVLKINGEDKLSEIINGSLVIDAPLRSYAIEAKFEKKTVLLIKAEYDKSQGRVEVQTPVYEGDQLKVEIKPSAGYVVDTVTYEDSPLSYDETEKVYVTQDGVTAAGKVLVTFKLSNENAGSEDDGCGSVTSSSLALVMLALGGAALFVKKNKS